ncbi:CinA family protein [Nitratiruptor sp. YY09-18]|uniref:CinA family protein n=1 Tax=Nitratiruptor sp. YY09-18 TaxID=2724901 RepID=UPI0019150BF4|nr:CinA family protein [Nitratiruptor sp. YY09-18]BCD67730.1 nicotinamide-nucleotide amidase [Nitratiruptor sp. YY09-18]
MQTALLFIGKEFQINDEFVSYVKRQLLKNVDTISAIVFYKERDKNLFVHIADFAKEYRNLLIVTTYESYPTVSKIIATLYDDTLVAKENFLVPTKATAAESNSFLIEANPSAINLLRVKIGEKLPKILLGLQNESTNLFIFGLDRAQIMEKIDPLAKSYDIGYVLTQETPELHKVFVYNKKYGDLAIFVQNLKLMLPQSMIVAHNVFEYLIERFTIAHKTITFAESCTGGLLASLLTKIPGSSNIFNGSLVTYANEIKHAWLGVKKETLEAFGAVSEETVEEMLRGALKVASADYAIAISGIAGPGGATPTKPVGTVVVGCRGKESELIRTMHFKGDRNYIQYQAAMYGVRLLFEIAKEELF